MGNNSASDEKQAEVTDSKTDPSDDSAPSTDLSIAQKIAANEQALGLTDTNGSTTTTALSKKSQMVGTDNGTDLDDYLFYLDEILERIHFSFYHTLDEVNNIGASNLLIVAFSI